MSASIRRTLAAVMVAALLGFSATPASATDSPAYAAETPVVFDAVFLRPLGMVTLGLGTALFAVSVPIVLVTRPMDIGAPFRQLVIRPIEYTWGDPLGQH